MWQRFFLFLTLLVVTTTTQGDVVFPLQSGRVGDRMVTMDANGNRVKLACVNWYGAHMEDMVVNGLDRQPISNIAQIIADLGFNCVRLPFALDTIFKNPVVRAERLSANPEMIGMTAMEVFDETIKALTDAKIIILPNNHMSTAMWCCSPDDGEGLWYTDEYPEEDFIEGWRQITTRYKDNPWVAGMDLRNELRPAHGTMAAWGNGKQNDWALAAEKAGNVILDVNPDVLVIVGGILSNGNLMGALTHPIQLTLPGKLVYTGHIYPFSPIISDLPYPYYKMVMHNMQTFVADAGFNYSAPYWMGEFGSGGGNDEKWQNILRFLTETDHDWAYWSIDGYKYPDQGEGYGLLEDDYVTIRHQWKIDQLQAIMPVLSNHDGDQH